MTSYSWTCPYCNQIATITESNVSDDEHKFYCSNKEKTPLSLLSFVVVCPNISCQEYSIDIALHKNRPIGNGATRLDKDSFLTWKLRPQSAAKPFPDYVPAPIRMDYQEACLIAQLSPKASATLARRCLQGIIRDYWKIVKSRLFDEIAELEGKIDAMTWNAIDAVRSIGNIGAHMEKDINLIIDVDQDEAALLVQLIELLIVEWYVRRHEREEHMNRIIAAAASKTLQK